MAALWEKLLFWKKNKKLIENVDYRFIDFNDSEITGIELLTGNYAGVVYYYGKVKVSEDMGIVRLQFAYNITQPGNFTEEQLTSDEVFYTIMGDILSEILLTKGNNEARNDNSEELDLY